MRLADDLIAISHGNSAVRLRPSLRAAVRLHAQYGLPELSELIAPGDNLGAVADIILEATDPETGARLVNAINAAGMQHLHRYREPLTDYMFALLAIDRSKVKGQAKTSDTANVQQTIEEFHQSLFEIGTGWLGWTPADTWAASPREILVAQRGLVAKLKAVNGVVDETLQYDSTDEVTPEQVKTGLATLRELSGAA